ncbi:hypothetical protein [Parathalassolituus penaei]|uniref:Uncharacterized protein n=1 Tax=Parathalassolituus penaei TaxID=2997323 RepID=A0A9X3EG20_9GAMM|nr:hypothetical protein [Parathalassolituus penaei]MCY0966085.1 hypothetical protein [Parathalassolituus penaei]
MKTGLLTALMLLASTPLWADEIRANDSYQRHCVYTHTASETFWQGACSEEFNYATNEHRVVFEDKSILISDYEPMRHELPWMMLQLNGEAAVAYLHHRSWTSYSSLDLGTALDVCDGPDESGGCQ